MEQQIMGQSKVWDHKSWLQEGLARRADLMAEKARLEEMRESTDVKIAEIEKVLEAMESFVPPPEPTKRTTGVTLSVRSALDRLFSNPQYSGAYTEAQIAEASGQDIRQVQQALVRLTATKEVERTGRRGAWLYSRPAPKGPLDQTPSAKILRAIDDSKTKSLTESEASWAVGGDLNLAKQTLHEMAEEHVLEESSEDRGTGDGERVWVLVDRRSY